MLQQRDFNKVVNDQNNRIYTLTNKNGLVVQLMNYGATVLSIIVPDRTGRKEDIVLGYNTIDKYIENRSFYGATIGQYANRINNGKFSLDGKLFQLEANDTEKNHLHGGNKGLDTKMWDAVYNKEKQSISFSCISKEGEGNYPGELSIELYYSLTDTDELIINYTARSNRATIINLTNHSFFNLKGEGHGDILDHTLQLNASKFTPIDNRKIPTGELRNVKESPMDFSVNTRIGERIFEDYKQLVITDGYDHNWIINKSNDTVKLAAVVHEPVTGRMMEVWTDQPGIQFYTSSHLDGNDIGKSGRQYLKYGALCIETQHFPDSPNHPHFPSTVLRKGDTYQHTCIYKFGIWKES